MGWGQGFNAFAQNASQGIMQGMQLQQKREADQADNAYKQQAMNMQERQLAPHLQTFKPSEFASMTNTLAKMGVTPDTNLYKRMEESAYDPAVTKGDMYQRLKENLPEYTMEVRNKLASMIAKNDGKPETEEFKKQKDLLDSLTTPEALVMNLMPKTHESIQYERQVREAALNKHEIWAAGSSRQVPDGKGGWKWLTAPNKPVAGSEPKITGNMALNPSSGKSEYLMTDGNFSGKEAGHKPATPLDVTRVQKMIADGADPTSVQAAAEQIGYEYAPETRPAKWNELGDTKEEWKLRKATTVAPQQKDKPFVIPEGAETGTYKGTKAFKKGDKFYSIADGKELK
jgi:hypothetical protein